MINDLVRTRTRDREQEGAPIFAITDNWGSPGPRTIEPVGEGDGRCATPQWYEEFIPFTRCILRSVK